MAWVAIPNNPDWEYNNDPSASDKNGIPKVYGKSPSRGDSAGRLVVTDKPVKGKVIIF